MSAKGGYGGGNLGDMAYMSGGFMGDTWTWLDMDMDTHMHMDGHGQTQIGHEHIEIGGIW